MKIEAKNIGTNVASPFDFDPFWADIYVNGAKAAQAFNYGFDNKTNLIPYGDQGKDLINQAEEWCKRLPPQPLYKNSDGKIVYQQWNLDMYAADMVRKHLNKPKRSVIKRIISDIPAKLFKRKL